MQDAISSEIAINDLIFLEIRDPFLSTMSLLCKKYLYEKFSWFDNLLKLNNNGKLMKLIKEWNLYPIT